MSKQQTLLDWLSRVDGNMLLESQVVSSGLSAALNQLLRNGLADLVAHPAVKERGGAPACAVILRKPAPPSHWSPDSHLGTLQDRVHQDGATRKVVVTKVLVHEVYNTVTGDYTSNPLGTT